MKKGMKKLIAGVLAAGLLFTVGGGQAEAKSYKSKSSKSSYSKSSKRSSSGQYRKTVRVKAHFNKGRYVHQRMRNSVKRY